jgi:hypothetical protein
MCAIVDAHGLPGNLGNNLPADINHIEAQVWNPGALRNIAWESAAVKTGG